MKFAFCFSLVVFSIFLDSVTSQNVDCDFDNGRQAFCGWKREWFGMRRAGWRSGKKIRRFRLGDHTTGSVYLVGEGDQVESRTPLWTKADGTPRINGFEEVVVPLDAAINAENGNVQIVFETIRGKSKKSVVAIDDVTLTSCTKVTGHESANDRHLELEHDDFDNEAEKKMHDVEQTLIDLMLPARRAEIKVMQFPNPATGHSISTAPNGTESLNTPRFDLQHGFNGFRDSDVVKRPFPKGRRGKKRKGKRGKGKKGGKWFRSGENQRRNPVDNVYLRGSFHDLHPILEPTLPTAPISPITMCDFIQYSQRLGRCFRSFFSALQRRPKTCSAQYVILESCLINSALSCVPEDSLDRNRVEEIIIEALQNKLQTRKVFCKENGAFVYPQFAADKLQIQCGTRYFIKLSECSGSFSSLFHIQHGDPQLCRLYYKANECQRQATADECNFDVETMLYYGLNLQYQIAHNPFCLNLPFSSWWPES